MSSILERIKDALDDIADDLDDDALKEAVAEHIDSSDIIGELIKEDENIQNALKKKFKELLIKDIEDINDSDDLEGYMDGSWGDKTENIFGDENIKNIIEELTEDTKVQDMLKKKVKELIVSQMDDMSTDDLPVNIWDKEEIADRIKIIMADHTFLGEYTEMFNKALKKVIVSMTKENDRSFEKFIKEHPQTQFMLQNRVESMMQDNAFLEDLRKALVVRVKDTPDLQKTLLNLLFNKTAEHLVELMFKKV